MDHPLLAVAPYLGLAAAGICHVIAAWVTGGRRILRALGVGTALGLAATALAGLAVTELPTADWVALTAFNLVTYLALMYVYVNVVNVSVVSLRLRILAEVSAAPNGLTREDLLALYDSRLLVDNRLRRLVGSNQLREQDGRYYTQLCRRLWVARVMWFLKWMILGQRQRP